MKTALAFVAAAVVAFSLSSGASAQKWDAKGRCHAQGGKLAKADVCAGLPKPDAATPSAASASKPAMAANPATSTSGAAQPPPAKTVRCRNGNRFAKCGTPGAVPIPTNQKSDS